MAVDQSEYSRQTGSILSHPGTANIITIVDEPEENTVIYSWKDGQLKRLPYEEHEARTGQKIKTFMTFVKLEKVIVININKEQMCLSVTNGIIEENTLKHAKNPTKFYSGSPWSQTSGRHNHKVPADNPVLFFSLDPEDFGEEIRGRVLQEDVSKNEKTYLLGQSVCTVGVVGDYGMWGKAVTENDEDSQKI